jgi:hypothetical protein
MKTLFFVFVLTMSNFTFGQTGFVAVLKETLKNPTTQEKVSIGLIGASTVSSGGAIGMAELSVKATTEASVKNFSKLAKKLVYAQIVLGVSGIVGLFDEVVNDGSSCKS